MCTSANVQSTLLPLKHFVLLRQLGSLKGSCSQLVFTQPTAHSPWHFQPHARLENLGANIDEPLCTCSMTLDCGDLQSQTWESLKVKKSLFNVDITIKGGLAVGIGWAARQANLGAMAEGLLPKSAGCIPLRAIAFQTKTGT